MALKKEYGTPRRTLIEQGRDGEINDIDVIANEETIVVSFPFSHMAVDSTESSLHSLLIVSSKT